MAMKPVTFDAYLKWYESHDIVVKSETVGKRPLQKGTTTVNTIENQKGVTVDAAVTALDNHVANGSNTAKKVVPHANQKKVEQVEGEFEDLEMEVEVEELDGEWEKVGGGEEDEDGEWDLV